MSNKKINSAIAQAEAVLQGENVSPESIQRVAALLTAVSKEADPWWVIVLKTLAYLIGLILAGMGTPAAACILV
jgi:hypothetical protein